MGKWSQYSKRGSARHHGALVAPLLADFSTGTITTNQINVNRTPAFPSGATGFIAQAQLQSGGAIVSNSPLTTGFIAPITGLTPVTAYRWRVAWFNGSNQVSDWGPWTNASTV